MCLKFATFAWPNYRLWPDIRRRANLNFLNELENDRAFGGLPNGFKKPFLVEETSASERTTENSVSWKSADAATIQEDPFAANSANPKLPTSGLLARFVELVANYRASARLAD